MSKTHTYNRFTEFLDLPWGAGPIRDDDKCEEAGGSGVCPPCVGTSGEVVEIEDRGGLQTLSVSLVPGESSRSPWARQSVWAWHFIECDSTAEKVPLLHGLQTTSSVSLPRFFILVPGGQSEWGWHSVPPSLDRKLLGGHTQMRSWVVVQGSFATRPTGHGARQRWHCSTPFSPRVKVPLGQGLHSLTTNREQWTDTKVPAGHLSQTSWVPESASTCWYWRGDRMGRSAALPVVKTWTEICTSSMHKS